MREQELLAILDAGPIDPASLAFMSAHRRKRGLLSIDSLIDLLDALEPDPDLEPSFGHLPPGGLDECEPDNDLEPSLGSLGGCVSAAHFDQRLWAAGNGRDAEQDVHDEPHDDVDGDREPDLGALEELQDQRSWAAHCHVEDEASLGAPENPHDQRHWAQGKKGSREGDHSEWTCFGAVGWQHREALARIRRETEEMLRGKRLVRAYDSDCVVIIGPGVAQMWGVR